MTVVYRDENGKEVQGSMLQLMSRPEDDPFLGAAIIEQLSESQGVEGC